TISASTASFVAPVSLRLQLFGLKCFQNVIASVERAEDSTRPERGARERSARAPARGRVALVVPLEHALHARERLVERLREALGAPVDDEHGAVADARDELDP